MTNLYPNPIVLAFISDLDENIVFKDVWAGVSLDGVAYRDIHIDFINPVTGSVDQAQFEMSDDYELLRLDLYEPGTGPEGQVQVAEFCVHGRRFVCIDSPIPHEWDMTPGVAPFVVCDDEAEMIGQHVTHDGDPEAVRALLENQETRPLGALIARCLRRDPRDRITIRQARQFLADLSLGVDDHHWPVRIAS